MPHPSALIDLCCPDCRTSLFRNECPQCHQVFPTNVRGQLDLRPTRRRTVTVALEVGAPLPAVDYSMNPQVRIPPGQGLALSLGCGDGSDRTKIEALGYAYIGVDWEPLAPDPTLVCVDAHALPFQDNSFDCVYSHSVLEHIQHPGVCAREVLRVLKPHGTFVGVCSFLEPQHGGSFYHHTHLGLLNTLHSAGFHVERICPTKGWTVLRAQVGMGYFPWITRYPFKPVFWALEQLHKVAWYGFYLFDGTVRIRKRASSGPHHTRMDRRRERELKFAGSLRWLARKPPMVVSP